MTCRACGRSVPTRAPTCPACGRPLGFEADARGSSLALGTQETVFVADQVTSADGRTALTGAGFAPRTAAAVESGQFAGPLRPGEAFGPRYHIIRLLGIGGMGAVYQAWDAELGVAVAIKVILPSVTDDPTAAGDVEGRFKRELLLAREVTHKNVVRIHDLGEIDGIKYITMSYVDGEDLAAMMKREGRLPVATVLKIARPVLSGLMAAHAAGIVHRDLKPANIMVEKNGEALIMDFGIARSTAGPVIDGKSRAGLPPGSIRPSLSQFAPTMVGSVVGTVEYMAPEQAKGQQVDQRADIYAFGLILYDMLAGGRRAEHAASAVEELKRRMERGPQSVKSVVPDIPGALNALISQCLEPDPAGRYQTTQQLSADLARLDEHGEPLPMTRVVGTKMVAAVVVVALGLLGGTWWSARSLAPPKPHDPVTVVIADIRNNTGDPAFDGALEPTLRRALESASFISAYERARISGSFGVRPPETLDEAEALAFAAKQGIGVVLSGAIGRRGNGYEISMKSVQAVTGTVVVDTSARAASKEQILDVLTRLVSAVRRALGDETSDSAQMFAMRSISATSLEVVRLYAAALDAQSDGKYEEARQNALKAVQLDPEFGMGYSLLGGMSRNLGNLQDAEKFSSQALSYLDGMTERERFAARGFYYRVAGDHQQCVKEYGDMTALFAADVGAHNQRALCLSKLRKMRESVDEIRKAVEILPRRVLFRGNLAVYAAYSGDFQTAEQEVRAVQEPNDLVTLALAFAQSGQGLLPQASETFEALRTMSPRGASWAASGLAQLALYEGRISQAIGLLEDGASADLAAGNADRAARKLASLAFAHLVRGETAPATAAAEKALQNSSAMEARFLAARILVETGALDQARAIAAELASALPAEPQAYGKILQGEIALKGGDAPQAIKLLSDANGVLDTWLGHFALGRAYLEAGALPQAGSEFDRCIQRRGEALSLLVDEEPTYGYFPIAYYFQGLAREGLKNAGFADSYREYLRIRGASSEDPLLPEVRRRAASPLTSSWSR